jgi:hypothetical protein
MTLIKSFDLNDADYHPKFLSSITEVAMRLSRGK